MNLKIGPSVETIPLRIENFANKGNTNLMTNKILYPTYQKLLIAVNILLLVEIL